MDNQNNNEDLSDNWFPLESNPDVMNPYIQSLGFDISKFQWHDLMSTEDWAQEMIPKPCVGVVFLFPITENTQKSDLEESKIVQNISPNVYYMKQYATNACGTVGLMHTILNVLDKEQNLLQENSILQRFLNATKDMTPEERGNYFLQFNDLKYVHQQAVSEGVGEVCETVDTHFISFIEKDGCLYELDGSKKSPINHGPCTPDSFLADACVLAKKLMERDPNQINFTLLALSKAQLE